MRVRPLVASVIAVGLSFSVGALAQTRSEAEVRTEGGAEVRTEVEEKKSVSDREQQQQMQTGARESQQGQPSAEVKGAEAGVPLNQLSKDQIQNLQRQLQERALYFGSIDGIAGPKTKAALKNYQTQQGLQVTAALTPETAESLGLTWDEIQRQPVRGAESAGQMQRQAQSSAMSQHGQAAEIGSDISQLGADHVRQLQQRLQELGFYKGNVDGVAGPQTKLALQRYFREQALLATQGKITDSALGAFGIEESERQPTRGLERGEPQRQPGAVESQPRPQPPQQKPEVEPPVPEGELEAPPQPIPEQMGTEPPEGEGQGRQY